MSLSLNPSQAHIDSGFDSCSEETQSSDSSPQSEPTRAAPSSSLTDVIGEVVDEWATIQIDASDDEEDETGFSLSSDLLLLVELLRARDEDDYRSVWAWSTIEDVSALSGEAPDASDEFCSAPPATPELYGSSPASTLVELFGDSDIEEFQGDVISMILDCESQYPIPIATSVTEELCVDAIVSVLQREAQ